MKIITKNYKMENQNEEIVSALNDLVEINNDRVEGYLKAVKETEEEDLKSLFNSMADQSRNILVQLKSEIISKGGTPEEGTTNSGKLYRIWMDVKTGLSTNDRKTVLNNCEYGEDAALDAYEKAIKQLANIGGHDLTLVKGQQVEIKKSHDTIRTMRDAVTI